MITVNHPIFFYVNMLLISVIIAIMQRNIHKNMLSKVKY